MRHRHHGRGSHSMHARVRRVDRLSVLAAQTKRYEMAPRSCRRKRRGDVQGNTVSRSGRRLHRPDAFRHNATRLSLLILSPHAQRRIPSRRLHSPVVCPRARVGLGVSFVRADRVHTGNTRCDSVHACGVSSLDPRTLHKGATDKLHGQRVHAMSRHPRIERTSLLQHTVGRTALLRRRAVTVRSLQCTVLHVRGLGAMDVSPKNEPVTY